MRAFVAATDKMCFEEDVEKGKKLLNVKTPQYKKKRKLKAVQTESPPEKAVGRFLFSTHLQRR